jgi:hypothetical protein
MMGLWCVRNGAILRCSQDSRKPVWHTVRYRQRTLTAEIVVAVKLAGTNDHEGVPIFIDSGRCNGAEKRDPATRNTQSKTPNLRFRLAFGSKGRDLSALQKWSKKQNRPSDNSFTKDDYRHSRHNRSRALS